MQNALKPRRHPVDGPRARDARQLGRPDQPRVGREAGDGGERFFQLRPRLGAQVELVDRGKAPCVRGAVPLGGAVGGVEVVEGERVEVDGALLGEVRDVGGDHRDGQAPVADVVLADDGVALPIEDPATFDLRGNPGSLARRRRALEDMYAEVEGVLGESARNTFSTIDLLDEIDFDSYLPAGGASYPGDELGQALRSTAALIRAEVGVEAVSVDLSGWDTHDFQAPLDGQMSVVMASLAQGLAAFHQDLDGADQRNYVVVVMSEFGRNAFENGSLGTDHGHGGVMMTLGGHVAGGRVVTEWPGLAPGQLFEEQDLAITIDYRDVLAEILTKRLDNGDIGAVFADPSYSPVDRGIVAA